MHYQSSIIDYIGKRCMFKADAISCFTQKYMFSKCLLRHDVVRVFVSSLVLIFVRAILSRCP